ncbi:hypothetical protein WMF31_01120 [Sorangium sp. So ce1036]|uniref:hypothetical protein n=1 Tax=Sorangium sp. So ce1036 TaxID=3133328 RepID=UPI003F0A2C19
MREAGFAYCLFTTKEPQQWKWHLEHLGKQCGEAWRADLSEEDRAWAAPYREKFSKWIDDSGHPAVGHKANAGDLPSAHGRFAGEPAPPWPMLLEAVQSAFFAFIEGFKKERSGSSEPAAADPMSRLHRTHLWQRLTSDDTAEADRAEALRAFRRGFRSGRRGKPKTLTRPIPPMLEPCPSWEVAAPELPGPSAARERALRALPAPDDPKERTVREQELRALYASAWREDVPEEDRIWAAVYRELCTLWVNHRRRRALAESAYEGHLQSSDGRFGGAPAQPWSSLGVFGQEPWCSFVDRIEDAPEGESELETAEAATWEYWDALYREAPPWDSDPAQAHWLAAVRAARRKALADDVVPEEAR